MESAESSESSGHVQASSSSAVVLGIIGFGMFMYFIVSIAALPALAQLSYVPFEEACVFRGAAVAAMAATFAVSYFLADRIMARYRAVLSVGLLLMLAAFACGVCAHLMGGAPAWVSVCAQVAFGIGLAGSSLLWIILFASSQSKDVSLVVSAGMCLGTLLFVAVNLNQDQPILILGESALFAFVSILIARYLTRDVSGDRWLSQEEYDETRISLADFPVNIHIAMEGAAYGFVAVVVGSFGLGPIVVLSSSGVLGAIVAICFAVAKPGFSVDTTVIRRVSVPILIAGLLIMPLCGESGIVACGCAVVAALSLNMVLFWSRTASICFEFHYHPIKWLSYRQGADWIGFLAGTLLGAALVFLRGFDGVTFSIFVTVLALGVVTTFCICGSDKNEVGDLLASLIVDAPLKEAELAEAAEDDRSVFEKSGEELARSSRLTERETEVFLLLARGRNAKAIQERLVISESTVKTHIYNIYRKLGINTQQALLDLVEERENELRADHVSHA